MNVYDGIHWNIYDVLPYQRNFNLINSERSIGKTFTTLFYFIDKCITKKLEFVYITRTKEEKQKNALEKAVSKVINLKFPNYIFNFNNEYFSLENEVIGRCIALSEAHKIKKNSYPAVKYMIFDEYCLEENAKKFYVNGFKEPDLLLNIYHTIDREEDRVICFLLGNNIKFYNPYHIHPAFSIPKIEKGTIWTSENVLFQNAVSSTELKNKKSSSKFVNMIKNTDYGNYAYNGNYLDDNESFIHSLTPNSKYFCTLSYLNDDYAVYCDYKLGILIISNKIDPYCKFNFALTLSDHKENTLLTKSARFTHLEFIKKNFKLGNIRFENMLIKSKIENGIALLL